MNFLPWTTPRAVWISFLAGLASCSGDHPTLHVEFSGPNAHRHVADIVAMGPRPAGSPELDASRRWLDDKLTTWGWQAQRQIFQEETPRGKLEFVNLRYRHDGGNAEGLSLWERPVSGLLLSHYDTKTVDDYPFVGANDPGSSLGVVLEMARLLANKPDLATKLEIVLFDGEEALVKFDAADGLYGSRYYASVLRRWDPSSRPRWGVLLDLIGHRGVRVSIPQDTPSALAKKLFQASDDLGYKDHFGFHPGSLIDDHVPLIAAGVPTIDLIDMNYPQWHTREDTLERIDPLSLNMVGRTATLMVERLLAPQNGDSVKP